MVFLIDVKIPGGKSTNWYLFVSVSLDLEFEQNALQVISA